MFVQLVDAESSKLEFILHSDLYYLVRLPDRPCKYFNNLHSEDIE